MREQAVERARQFECRVKGYMYFAAAAAVIIGIRAAGYGYSPHVQFQLWVPPCAVCSFSVAPSWSLVPERILVICPPALRKARVCSAMA
jgi:hypothetical protein